MPRIRVYELARRYRLASSTLIELLNDIEVPVEHHMSGLDEEQLEKAAKLLEGIKRGTEPLIVLCYSTKDKKFMHRLRRDLTTAGFTVWTADRIIPGTPAWARAIEEAIKSSRCVVVILSRNAKKSVWVAREIYFAQQHDKSVVPVLARDDPKHVVPLELAGSQWIDARRPKYKKALKSLKKALRQQAGTTRQR